MAPRRELLLGKIALREKVLSREALYDCLLAQERNPSKTLGEIMIRRRYATAEQVRRILDLQKAAFEEARRSDGDSSELLGQILIQKGFATEYQVHECLRLQARMDEAGIRPVPPIGEILVRRGYIQREALDTALALQQSSLYACPECEKPIPMALPKGEDGTLRCPSCGSVLPALYEKMVGSLHAAIQRAEAELDIDLPEEVRAAAKVDSNNFGRYVLVREIGRGGAGVVYKAWQKDRNAYAALKMLSHESETGAGIKTPWGDAEDIRRFYSEMRSVAELNHPNIVPILDFAVIEETLYFTMTFIDGATLDEMVRHGIDETGRTTRERRDEDERRAKEPAPPNPPAPDAEPDRAETHGTRLPVAKALAIMAAVARAVHAAHERGVYHRDIKPSNIMIDRAGKAWVTDFGLAKVVHLGDPAYVKGVIMGTPYYMPPEQASGDMEQVNHLSDVYSLGAVLYEAVTGCSPFADKSPDTVIDLLPTQMPDPARKLCPDIPADVEAILNKSMARDKKARYPSAAAFAEDIERHLAGLPLNPEPYGGRATSGFERIWRKLLGR